MIRAHIFDMDGTLISGDTDVSWQEFLIDERLAPPSARAENERFYRAYLDGTLNPDEFLEFQFRTLIGRPVAEYRALARRHFEERIRPMLRPAARDFVAGCLRSGTPAAVLSSTDAGLIGPAARELGIEAAIGTELEVRDGLLTAHLARPYGFGPGKVECAGLWLRRLGVSWAETACYGDSINDRFLLEKAGFPVAVNPGPELRGLARERNWPVLDWESSRTVRG